MENRETDTHRRKFLTVATVGASGAGLLAASMPFVENMLPSEEAKAAGAAIEVDLGPVGPGTLMMVEWRGKPVWIVHRNDQMLDLLEKHGKQLVDPQSKELQQSDYVKLCVPFQ